VLVRGKRRRLPENFDWNACAAFRQAPVLPGRVVALDDGITGE
jgi:hypothetical protein